MPGVEEGFCPGPARTWSPGLTPTHHPPTPPDKYDPPAHPPRPQHLSNLLADDCYPARLVGTRLVGVLFSAWEDSKVSRRSGHSSRQESGALEQLAENGCRRPQQSQHAPVLGSAINGTVRPGQL